MLVLLFLFAILASILNVVGTHVKSVAAVRTKRNVGLFYIGLGIEIAGAGCDAVALLFGPQMVKASMGALPIFFNVVIPPILGRIRCFKLQDPVKCGWKMLPMLASYLVIFAGSSLSVSAFFVSSVQSFDTSANATVAHLYDPASAGYLGMMITVSTIASSAFWCEEVYGSLPIYSGIFASLTVVFVKAGLQLLGSEYGYELVAVTCAGLYTLFAQSWLMTQAIWKGVKRTRTVPLYTTTYVIGASVSGGIVYDEFQGYGAASWSMFGVGCGLVIVGVAWLVTQPVDNDEEETEVVEEKVL